MQLQCTDLQGVPWWFISYPTLAKAYYCLLLLSSRRHLVLLGQTCPWDPSVPACPHSLPWKTYCLLVLWQKIIQWPVNSDMLQAIGFFKKWYYLPWLPKLLQQYTMPLTIKQIMLATAYTGRKWNTYVFNQLPELTSVNKIYLNGISTQVILLYQLCCTKVGTTRAINFKRKFQNL